MNSKIYKKGAEQSTFYYNNQPWTPLDQSMNLENMFNSGFTSLDGQSRISSNAKKSLYSKKGNRTPTKIIHPKDKIGNNVNSRNNPLMFGSSVEVQGNVMYPPVAQSDIYSSSKETFYLRE